MTAFQQLNEAKEEEVEEQNDGGQLTSRLRRVLERDDDCLCRRKTYDGLGRVCVCI